jgi:ribosomal protein S27AE
MSEKMTAARAAEILDPAHRESYESLGVVEEACRMGREALLLRIPRSPFPDGDKSILACPNCGSGEYLHNQDEAENTFCGQCGQAIDWAEVYDG